MQLEELKQNITGLDQLLAKTGSAVEVNVTASETAQGKILKNYRQSFINCLILTVVFTCLWMGNVSSLKLPNMYKAFIVIQSLLGAAWYMYLYFRLRKVDISRLTPGRLFSETTKIKLLTLSGEVFFGILLTVFFTLLLSFLMGSNPLAFWLIIATIAIALVIGVIYTWPRYMKLFRDLNSIR